ncbi:MAG: hypothetical protein KF823_02670 [Xanthomonadales bacterium]|nr:hypothetical protein [Xanthomonadales bacterium]
MAERSQHAGANLFVRILIALLCLLIAGMILFRFLQVQPVGEISPGLLSLLGLLVVLVLAEAFDNFSVGKLLSVSREVRKKEAEVERLEKQNSYLLSQLITVSNSQAQRQSSTTVQGDYYASSPTVQRASEAEVEEKNSTENRALSATAADTPARTRMNWEKAEEIALTKLLKRREINPSNVITDAKLSFQFQGIDPVSNIQPIFDGYIKSSERETFIDIRPERLVNPIYRDRLYVMLSKIHHYRVAKNVEAHLDLVMLKIPGEEGRGTWGSFDRNRFFQHFEPAIASGLLRIEDVEFTEEEAAQCRET